MTGSYGYPEFSTEIPDSALSEVSHSNHRPAYPPPLPPRRHHRGVGLARLGANLEAARPIWPRPSTPSLAHRPGRPHTSYRSEVPERRIGPDGDADGSWGITRGRVTMLRPKIGTARLSVLRSRYSPPVRPEGRLRPARALFANCGRTSELIGSKAVWCVAQGPYPTHRGPSRPVDLIWSERHYRTVARTDRLKSGRPPHSARPLGVLNIIFTLSLVGG